MTEHDDPIEYDTITEGDENTTRTTKTPRMPDSKDSQDPKPPEGESKPAIILKTMEAAGKPLVDISAHIAQKQRESKLPQDQSEDNSSDE